METSNKLFIGNLNWQTKWRELKDHFAQYGEVAFASIGWDRERRRSKGFGFITFVNEEDAVKVKEANDAEQMEFMERPLYIEYAQPREGEEEYNKDSSDSDNTEEAEETTEIDAEEAEEDTQE